MLVAGLLRGHARILSALHQLGVPVDDRGNPGSPQGRVALPLAPPAGGRALSRAAPDILGSTLEDETVSLAVGATTVDTLLAFLSGGCTTCAGLWADMPNAELGLPPRTRLVVVARAGDQESPARLRKLARPGMTLVMSNDAWEDYRVPGAPYFVLVAGATGTVLGEGSAKTWSQVLSLMAAATEDGKEGRRRKRDTDSELAAAGILPGDPRLVHPPIATGRGEGGS
ncbi:MAG: hypothetical protein NVSMB32_01280 [Actinomycetota bacterium]